MTRRPSGPAPTILGARPAHSCEHFWLRGNCPFCRIVELQKLIAAGTVIVERRVDDRELAQLLDQAARARDETRRLSMLLDQARADRDRAKAQVREIRRRMDELRAAGGQSTQVARLRAKVTALEADLRAARGTSAVKMTIENARLRRRIDALAAELRSTRALLSSRWSQV